MIQRNLLTLLIAGGLVCCVHPSTPGNITNGIARGIDISKYQGDEIDLLQKKQDSLAFVICKATEGITIIYSSFKNNWSLIREKGFVRGAYHFYHCDDDTILQVQNFCSTVGTLAENDLCPIVDVEETGVTACTVAAVQHNLLGFLRELARRTARVPMIYADNYTAATYLKDSSFGSYPLYIADYAGKPAPFVPFLWRQQGWSLWQKTDSFRVAGDFNDFDVFNGTLADLKTFIRTH